MSVEEFLGQLGDQGRFDSEGQFGLDSIRASRLQSVFLGADPCDCVVWVAYAALCGEASRIELQWQRPNFRFYDNAPKLSRAEAEALVGGGADSPRLRRLAMALYVAAAANPRGLFYASPDWLIRWNGSEFAMEPCRLNRDVFGRNYFSFDNRSFLESLSGFSEALKSSARYCPAKIFLNSRQLKRQKVVVPEQSPAALYWHHQGLDLGAEFAKAKGSKAIREMEQRTSPGAFSAVFWLKPKPSQVSFLSLVDLGLVTCKKTMSTGYPGFEAVIWADHWNYALSGEVREDEHFEQILEKIQGAARELLIGLPEADVLSPKGLALDGPPNLSKLMKAPLVPILADIQHVEISCDSRFLLVLSCDGVRLWEVRQGTFSMVAGFERFLDFRADKKWCSFCPDNQIFAVLTGSHEVAIVRRADGSCLQTVRLEQAILSLVFSPQGCLLYLVDVAGVLWSYEPLTQNLMQLVAPKKLNWPGLTCRGHAPLEITADGRWLALDQEEGLLLVETAGQATTRLAKQRLSCLDPASRFVISIEEKTKTLYVNWFASLSRPRKLCQDLFCEIYYPVTRPLVIGNSLVCVALRRKTHVASSAETEFAINLDDERISVADHVVFQDRVICSCSPGNRVFAKPELGAETVLDLGPWVDEEARTQDGFTRLSGPRLWSTSGADTFAACYQTRLVLGNLAGLVASWERPRRVWEAFTVSSDLIRLQGSSDQAGLQSWSWTFAGDATTSVFQETPAQVQQVDELEIWTRKKWQTGVEQALNLDNPNDEPEVAVYFKGAQCWTGRSASLWAPSRVLLQDVDGNWTVRCSHSWSLLYQLPSQSRYFPASHPDFLAFPSSDHGVDYLAPNPSLVKKSPELLKHSDFFSQSKRYLTYEDGQQRLYTEDGTLLESFGGVTSVWVDPSGRWMFACVRGEPSKPGRSHTFERSKTVSGTYPALSGGLSVFDMVNGECRQTLDLKELNQFRQPEFVWDCEGDGLCVVQESLVWPLRFDRETGQAELVGEVFRMPSARDSKLDDDGEYWNYNRRPTGYSVPLLCGQSLTVLAGGCLEIYRVGGELQLRLYLLADGYLAVCPDGSFEGVGEEFVGLVTDRRFCAVPNLLATVWRSLTRGGPEG